VDGQILTFTLSRTFCASDATQSHQDTSYNDKRQHWVHQEHYELAKKGEKVEMGKVMNLDQLNKRVQPHQYKYNLILHVEDHEAEEHQEEGC
jgi:hypothetical protein